MLIHLAEIAIWGLVYSWQNCLPDAESAFYFSGVTYTSLGYGELLLPKPWRMLSPAGDIDRHSHVRALDRAFLRACQPLDQQLDCKRQSALESHSPAPTRSA